MAQESTQLAKFTQSINDLINCELIIADKYIAKLLGVIAKCEKLVKCMTDTLKVNSYSVEFNRAIVSRVTSTGRTVRTLRLPEDNSRKISLVIGLLGEIDLERRNLIKLLQEYFEGKNADASYAIFVDTILRPFKAACEIILRQEDEDSLNYYDIERAGKYFEADRIYISIDVLRQCLSLIENSRTIIRSFEQKLGLELCRDCLTACDSLNNALQYKNPRWIAITWLAYKYALGNIESTSNIVSALEVLLRQNKLI